MFVVGAIITVCMIGCGPQLPDGMPKLHPLTLTVTLEGQPFPDATVSLFPIDETMRSWSSGGVTAADGVLPVFTHGKYAGVPAGKYKVTVDCVTSDPPRPKVATFAEIEAHNRKYPDFRIVPLQFTDRETTPLEIEIVKGKNRLTVDIPERVKLRMNNAPP